jgi:molybdenum cofactor cytidylyltransferase
MNINTTVIVLAHELGNRMQASSPLEDASPFGVLNAMLHRVLASGLPMVLVAPQTVTAQARGLLPGNCLVDLPATPRNGTSPLVAAIAAGVHASAQSDGWLVLPADMPMLQPETLRRVANALQTSPIAYPQYHAQRGQPMGFGRELFSELIRLEHDRDLHRLSSRYPSQGIDVDDPGVVFQRHHEPQVNKGGRTPPANSANWFR